VSAEGDFMVCFLGGTDARIRRTTATRENDRGEREQETYKPVVAAIAALERVMHFGGLVTVPNLHNALIYLRSNRDHMEKQMRTRARSVR